MYAEYKKLIFYFLIILLVITVFLIINQIIISQFIYNINILSYKSNLENLLKITSRGVSQYLKSIQTDLKYLSLNEDVIDLNENGKYCIKEYYNTYSDVYTNVTRLNKYGIIEYTYPYNEQAIGKSVLYQEHNRRLYIEKKPVISKPFDAVQGYKAIAIAIPAFKGGEFDGTVSGLLDFNKIWDLFFSLIKTQDNTVFIVCNENCDIIYAPDSIITNNYKLDKLFLFNDGSKKLQKGFQFYKIELNNKIKDYYFSSICIEMENNTWYLITLIPESVILSNGRGIFVLESIFIFILTIILLIILIVFIYIYIKKVKEKENALKYAIDKEREKEFFKTSLDSISMSRHFFVFICNESGIIFYSNNHYNIKGKSIDDIFESSSAAIIHKYIENIKNYRDSILVNLNMIIDKNNEFIFNVSYRKIENKKYFIFAGFNLEGEKSTPHSVYLQIINDFYTNDTPTVICDIEGNIIMYNRKFRESFGYLKTILDIDDRELNYSIKRGLLAMNTDIKEMQINLKENIKFSYLILLPIFNDFMKLKYISIEFK